MPELDSRLEERMSLSWRITLETRRCIPVLLQYTRNDLSNYLNFANSLIRCILLSSPTCAYLTSIYLRTWFC